MAFLTPGTSLRIFWAGLLIQVGLTTLLVLRLGPDQPGEDVLTSILAGTWYVLPLLSGLFGIIVGVTCYFQRIGTVGPLLGIVIDALWLVVFGLVFLAVFVAGITV